MAIFSKSVLHFRWYLWPYLGPGGMDLRLRGLPSSLPSQGRRRLRIRQLDLQSRACTLRSVRLYQYPVEDVYDFWDVLYRHDLLGLFPVS